MIRRRRSREAPRLNLTPLIDTVFLLLVFFMMTTTFNRQSQLKVDLPQAKGDAVEQPEIIRILIDAEGDYAINDWEHSLINNDLETVKRAVKKAVGEQVNTPLLISADSLAPHQAVMRVMEAVRDLGFTRLGFEAQQVTTDAVTPTEKVP